MDRDEIADQMARKRNALAAAHANLSELHKAMTVIRARLQLEINDELDDMLRKRYGNETARRAALTVRLAEHAEHEALDAEARRLRVEIEVLRGEYQDLHLRWMDGF